MNKMLENISVICMVIMFMAVIFLCALIYLPLHEAKKVDCALAEFSPDISTEIKQLCREARKTK
jgi:hypothetical protein